MSSLLHPVGPKSPGVYWLRRVLALIVVGLGVTALTFLVWGIAGTLDAPQTKTTEGEIGELGAGDLPSINSPVDCDAKAIKLKVEGFPRLSVDGKQVFNLTLTNSSAASCRYAVSPESYVLTVVSGSDRIWSTEDCPEWVPTQEGLVEPKSSVNFTIEWNLRRSNGSCKAVKDKLKPGTYVANVSWRDAKGRQVLYLVK